MLRGLWLGRVGGVGSILPVLFDRAVSLEQWVFGSLGCRLLLQMPMARGRRIPVLERLWVAFVAGREEYLEIGTVSRE